MRAARRQLLALLSWPLLQLVAAVMVVGILIYVMGMVKQDILGFGLVGTRGLVVYLNVLVAAAIALFLCLEAARRGAFWTKSHPAACDGPAACGRGVAYAGDREVHLGAPAGAGYADGSAGGFCPWRWTPVGTSGCRGTGGTWPTGSSVGCRSPRLWHRRALCRGS